MADTLATPTRDIPIHRDERENSPFSGLWKQLALAGVLFISLYMNFYQLGQNGFGNLYYAAGVRSMMDNLHNFLFVSFDPGAFVTIDKPPLGFWLQVASAKLFGFTPFSVFFPQALAGVLSVLLLYYLVRRHFGDIAGVLAALALALSPISVVTNRNNTIDSVLALALLLGTWAVLKAAETGKLRWLLLCAAIIGLGFNIKMLEAYLVVPAFGLLYVLAAPRKLWTRIGHLALATLLLLVISLSWAVAVDLTPAAQRPYVGSSQDNSEISLAFGYNGVSRLLGQFGNFGQRSRSDARSTSSNSSTTSNSGNGTTSTTPLGNGNGAFPANPGNPGSSNGGTTGANGNGPRFPQGGPGGPAGNGGSPFNTGTPGLLRLFNEPLASQTAWLLPLALLGILAVAWQRRLRIQEDRQQQSVVLWGMWLLTMGIFFSVAGFFHQYYLTEMAPAISALSGIGLVVMWQDYRRAGWRGWLLPIAILVTAAEQIHILASYPTWGQWLIPTIGILSLLAAAVLVVIRLLPDSSLAHASRRYLVPAMSVGILAILLAPAVWSAIPVVENVASQLPTAGPSQRDGFGGPGGPAGNANASANTALVRYLEANQGNATFLVATPSSNTADQIILTTNKPVMALGGFGGSDPILTTSQLAQLVAKGTVRFFLLGGARDRGQLPADILDRIPEQYRDLLRGGFGGPFGGQSSLTSWVTQHCSSVPSSAWQSSTSGNANGFGTASGLYDCATTH